VPKKLSHEEAIQIMLKASMPVKVKKDKKE
jgi:hypothetical protein